MQLHPKVLEVQWQPPRTCIFEDQASEIPTPHQERDETTFFLEEKSSSVRNNCWAGQNSFLGRTSFARRHGRRRRSRYKDARRSLRKFKYLETVFQESVSSCSCCAYNNIEATFSVLLNLTKDKRYIVIIIILFF